MYSIQKHLQYNAWANGKIVELLTPVSEDIMDVELKSSFSSIRKTITHIWDGQQVWLLRLQGESPTHWPSQNFTGDTKALLNAFVDHSHVLLNFIASKDKAYLESSIKYKTMSGTDYSTPVDVILYHLVNHGTFHRGQLITMLRELGFTSFESQDLITFLRM